MVKAALGENIMSVVTLDLGKLLGFKIIVTGQGRETLHSPKIGSKALKIRDDTLEAEVKIGVRPSA